MRQIQQEHQFDIDVDGQEEQEKMHANYAHCSDSSDSFGDSPTHGKAASYNAGAWPQSYRQSMDLYSASAATSPNLRFLSNSYIASSIPSSFRRRSFREVLPDSPTHSLLPTKAEDEEAAQGETQLPHVQIPPAKKVLSKKDIHVHGVTSQSHQCSFSHALLNGMNMLCGVGILSTPYAVKEGGWLGLSLLFIFALVSCYTGVLLRHCLESGPGVHTYPDIGQAAFGTIGRRTISIILYAELYVSMSLPSSFAAWGSSYLKVITYHLCFQMHTFDFGGIHLDSHKLFAIVTALSVLPTVWLRDLSLLSYISAGGVIASILVFVCLLWVGIVDQIGLSQKCTVLDLSNLPIAFGLYGYLYSGHSVYPNIYASMKNPSQFDAVLITCFVICTIMYAGVAVMGYMMFGDETESQFTLNMPNTFTASKLALWTTVVNPFTKYALTLTPVALSLEELLPSTTVNSSRLPVIIRSSLVISTLVVALTVPFFGLVMSLLGSLLSMFVVFILPSACFLRIVGERVTCSQVSLCVIIIVLGIVCSAIGTYSSVAEIVRSFH